MRLDKYLKVSRLIKRRTVANEVADAGRILINGKVAKASQAVNAGDIIEVTFGNRPIKVRAKEVKSNLEPFESSGQKVLLPMDTGCSDASISYTWNSSSREPIIDSSLQAMIKP